MSIQLPLLLNSDHIQVSYRHIDGPEPLVTLAGISRDIDCNCTFVDVFMAFPGGSPQGVVENLSGERQNTL